MAALDLLWHVQGIHEKVAHTMVAAERELAACNGVTVGGAPTTVAGVLSRTRRNLNLLLIEERRALRQYALANGVGEVDLPPAFDRTCRFAPRGPPPDSVFGASPSHPRTTPVKAPPASGTLHLSPPPDPDFDVRVLQTLMVRLRGQLRPLLRRAVSAPEQLTLDDVISHDAFDAARKLLTDIAKSVSRVCVLECVCARVSPPSYLPAWQCLRAAVCLSA